jgi:NAD(P)-dependent dehydrogenase (short-subunit alcohol dehydrogenase family)
MTAAGVPPPDLTGGVAVVTGGGSGIGRATALLLATHGAKVHVADLNAQAAQAVAGEIETGGGRAAHHELDVTDAGAVEAFADAVFAADGHVDVLHNNAGIGHAGNIEATTFEDWQRVISVNLLGVAYGVQAFAPRMLLQGRPAAIVNTASMAGLLPTAKMAPYTASKFGVVGLSEALNAELSSRGIHVSAICPGVINTPIVANGIMRGDIAAIHQQATSYYARRGTSPDEVAKAILRTIAKPRLIVPVPRRQVSPLYMLHRASPRLTQPLARGIERLIGRG